MLDGKIPRMGNFSTSECTSTEVESSRPYVVIDLKFQTVIQYILLYSRSDNQPKTVYEYFNYVEVHISSVSPYFAGSTECGASNVYEYSKNGTAYPFRKNCGGMYGRWLIIRTRARTQLTVCEVEVYG